MMTDTPELEDAIALVETFPHQIASLHAEVDRLREQARRQASLLDLDPDERKDLAEAYVTDWRALRAEITLLEHANHELVGHNQHMLAEVARISEQRDIWHTEFNRLSDRCYRLEAEIERLRKS